MFSAVLIVLVILVLAVLAVGLYFAFLTQRIARQAEQAVPPCGKFIDIKGEKIHYIERGEGRPILFIHGLGGSLHHMRRPLMENFGDDFHLVALDRPGSGYSTRLKQHDGRLSEQANLIADFIDAMGLQRPLLVGHSLGGAIALATALKYPEKVSGLALISPLTRFEENVRDEFKPLAIRSSLLRWLISRTVAIPASIKRAEQTLAFVFGPQRPPEDFAVAGGAFVGLRPSHFYAASTDLTALEHELRQQEARYNEIKMPVGIMFGTGDRVLDYERQGVARKSDIPGLQLEIVEGIGHMPQYAVTDQVISFIRTIAHKSF